MADGIMLLGLKIEIWAFIVSVIAIVFTLLKYFIFPWIFKPRLKFYYEEKPPFRRENIRSDKNPKLTKTYLRFSVKNTGRRPAINCRCQILKVEKNAKLHGDYQGFPLRWASRPESVLNQASGERLNIARGETNFMDLAVTSNQDNLIYLRKYHRVDVGIKEVIEPGKYDIFLIFSGDNFKPYTLQFSLTRKNSTNPNDIELKLIKQR